MFICEFNDMEIFSSICVAYIVFIKWSVDYVVEGKDGRKSSAISK